MSFVRTLEGIFEKYIEGYFNQKFSGNLQPIELAKKMAKEMVKKRSVGVAHIYVPNHYRLDINPADYEQLVCYAVAVQDELAQFLKAEAHKKGFTMLSNPQIDFFRNEKLRPGEFTIACDFIEPEDQPELKTPEIAPLIPEELQVSSDTRTFTRLDQIQVQVPSKLVPELPMATLTVEKGTDQGLCVDVLTRRIHMGRRESNELPLTDMNTSRLHAYIDFEDGKHVIYDAKSLNGTYVNDQRISRQILADGDKITVGHTDLLYEVN